MLTNLILMQKPNKKQYIDKIVASQKNFNIDPDRLAKHKIFTEISKWKKIIFQASDQVWRLIKLSELRSHRRSEDYVRNVEKFAKFTHANTFLTSCDKPKARSY